jgi:tetratricopeptide (TPR) repeat protein
VRRDGLAAPSSDLDRALSFELPPRVRIRVLGIAADFHMLRGEFGPARPLLEEGLERAVAVGCRYTEGRLRTELACALHALGARDEAVAHLEEAVRLLSDGEHCYGLIVALHWLGTSRLDAEQPDEALELLERALALDTEGQVDLIRAFLRVRVGVAAWMAGRSDVAKQHFEQSIADFEALEEPSGTIGSRLHLALVHAHAGDVSKCEATLRAMVEVMHRMGLYRERRRPLFEAHTVYAHARAARKRHGDESPETVEAHARAREVVDALCEEMAAETPLYARAFRLLAAAVEASAPERAAPIVVDRGGGGFVSPSGARVDLEGRPVLARVLEAIVAAAERAPGRPVERASIVEHAWAGERMSDASASSRVYVAVSTLRKLGLRDALRSVEGGYLLDLTRVRIAHRRHAHASTNEQGAGPPER